MTSGSDFQAMLPSFENSRKVEVSISLKTGFPRSREWRTVTAASPAALWTPRGAHPLCISPLLRGRRRGG